MLSATRGALLRGATAATGRAAITFAPASVSVLGVRSMTAAVATAAPAPSSASRMRSVLSTALSATHVEVEDTSGGCGSFFRITVVSPQFEGKMTIAQHRAVNAALEAEIGKMHGLTLRTLTPKQYEASQQAPKK